MFRKNAQQQNRQQRRHRQLMGMAHRLLVECHSAQVHADFLGRPVPHVVAGDLVALAFGSQLQVDQEEALRFLEAARVEAGLSRRLIAYPSVDEDREQDDDPAPAEPLEEEQPAQV
ncbi:hypothetical protein [Streptomyces sp. NPDC054842]